MSLALLFAILTVIAMLVPGFNPVLAPPYISLALVFAILTVIFLLIPR